MTLSQQQKQDVRRRAKYHCEYCKRSEEIVATTFEIDHILPISKGGLDDSDNLCCACRDCNAHKANRERCLDPETDEEITIFNPRTQKWSENFHWSDDGTIIIGITATGRATTNCLDLNNERIRKARFGWRKLDWTPPSD